MRITLSVAKVIALLEAKLVELNAWPEKEAAYEKARQAWDQRVALAAVEHGKIEGVTVYGKTVTVAYKATNLPKEPAPLLKPAGVGQWSSVDTAKTEVETALKFLRMTEKTEVSMSALKNVADYL